MGVGVGVGVCMGDGCAGGGCQIDCGRYALVVCAYVPVYSLFLGTRTLAFVFVLFFLFLYFFFFSKKNSRLIWEKTPRKDSPPTRNSCRHDQVQPGCPVFH